MRVSPDLRLVLLFVALFFFLRPAQGEQVVISEIMYNPPADKPEYIEVWNITRTPLDMGKWHFADGVTYTFPDFNSENPQAVFLRPGERILVSAANEAATRAAYPQIPAGVRIFGPFAGSLASEGERITLSDRNAVPICTVEYRDQSPWPKAADGAGHSLILRNENKMIDDFRAWGASFRSGGTPGLPDTGQPPSAPLRLSEVHFAEDGSLEWVELENTTDAPVEAGAFSIATLSDLSDKAPLSGSVPARGFATSPVSFPTESNGDIVLFLLDGENNVLATAELKRRAGRPSIQAIYPVAPAVVPAWEYLRLTPTWYSSTTATPNEPNTPPAPSPIVINEIMYDPPASHGGGEFIELYNKGTVPVDLTGWRIRGGVDYDFPAGTVVQAGGYLVIAREKAYMAQAYPGVSVLGNWLGSLKNAGDQFRIVDQHGNIVDEVDYRPGGDWPTLAAGQGSSMELIHPDMDNSRASAWRDSNESSKADWQTYTITGPYRQLRADGAVTDYKELHLHLVGDSHVALRNIKMNQGTTPTGTNIIPNIDVHSKTGSSASGWLMQGTHWASHINEAGELHLISDGHGDNRANRAEIDATAMTASQTYTLQFDARWISGKSRLIVQTWDHSFGKALLLPVPNALGTPGAANSSRSPSPLPQVDSILHSPAVPKTTDQVRVTARISSPTPLAAVEVVHRADTITNSNAWAASPMVDDGTGGDAVANDGVYTATLNQHQVNGRIVQFYVRATSGDNGTGVLPRAGENRPALWIVDNRTILTASDLRKQRLIIPASHRDALTTNSGQSPTYEYDFPRLSNHYFNATFIHNETDVYYQAELRKAGSPWTRPDTAPLDRGKWKLPGDRPFRNRDKFTFDNDVSGAARHHNRLIRYWLYILGHPVNENEFVSQTVNTDQLTAREDVEPVDGAMIRRNFPNGNDGQLLRSDDEWWFRDNWERSNRDADWSYKGTEDPIRYHTEWMLRSRENEYDYSTFTELCRTVSSAGSSEELINRVLDPQLMMMMAAVRGYAYDWDSFTLNRGKNGFMYRKPTDGRWIFLHWDSDLAFQDASNIVVGTRPGWGTLISKPWARRIFNYYLTEMVTKLTRNSARVNAWFDAEENASSAYTVNKSTYVSWFQARESRILQEINLGTNAYNAAFNVTSPAEGSTVEGATVTLAGTAPSRAFRIVVDGLPNATSRWMTQTAWQIPDVPLKTGTNSLTVRMVDHEGNDLGSKVFEIVKTENAPPVMQMTALPTSSNVRVGEIASLDASSSFDPDGGELQFSWAIDPPTSGSMWNPTPTRVDATFNRPGIYKVTVTGTDTQGASSSATRELLVYHAQDFSPMNDQRLESYWTPENINERDNFASDTWYSTQDVTGTLLVQVLSTVARPTHPTAPTHPLITRDLPDSADFALQTSLYLAARQTGAFLTGLYIETSESGSPVQYLFGIENGTQLVVKRSTGNSFVNIATQPSTGGSAVLRVSRVGNELHFQRRVDNVWAPALIIQELPEGTTATRGGFFVATTQAQDVRVGFDYVALSDTSRTAPVRDHLRITEIMYHPKDPDTVEYIELQNTGPEPLNLNGVYFEEGIPVQGMIFGDEVLAPGEFITVTNSIAAFRARYGDGPRLGGEWTGGSLSNSGERVILRDAEGNLIHDFTYLDSSPWPPDADGGGRSLVIKDTTANYTDSASWEASPRDGGSPGVGDENAAPVAQADILHLALGSEPLLIPVLANDSDPDGDVLTITDVSAAANGTIQVQDGAIRYEPGPSFTGSDTFTYTISDPQGETATATVTLTNQVPVAADDTMHVAWVAGAITLNVKENDADADSDPLTITTVGTPTHGTASTDGATISYIPGESFQGADQFTYTLSDGHGGTATATVTLTNALPIAGDDQASTQGAPVTINVLANDSDGNEDALTILNVTPGAHGSTAISEAGITYTPDATYDGEDAFTYTIGDGHGGTATAQVLIRNGDVLTRLIAESGAQVPGAPAGSTYQSLQVPSIGDDGSLAWVARVRVPGQKQPVLMLIGGASPTKLFGAGDPVPGIPGATFKKFHPPVSDDTGRTIFAAMLKGSGIQKSSNTALFSANPDGTTEVIARLGDSATGLPGATLKKFVAVDAEGGETVFVADTSSKGQTGVWTWDGTNVQLVAATGKPATTASGTKTIKKLSLLGNVPGSPGHNRGHQAGRVALRLTFTDKTEGIACASLVEGQWEMSVQMLGGSATGFGGAWAKFGAPALNATGRSVVHGTVANGGPQSAIAIFDENGPMEVVRAGDALTPGTTLSSFLDPVANSAGTIAFAAKVSGAGINKANALRLVVVPPGGELEVVAAQGQPTPIAGTTWKKFNSYALPEGETARPLLLATIAGSGVTKKNNLGLWSRNADGTLRLLARTGFPIPGSTSPRLLSRMTLLNALTPVQGSARSFNASRSIAYLATFQDGSQAIQVQRLP